MIGSNSLPSSVMWPKFVALLIAVSMMAVFSCLAVFFLFIRPILIAEADPTPFYRHLDLTEEQLAQVELIDSRFEEERRQLMVEFEAIRHELAQLLEQENSFTEAVAARVEAVHRVHGELQGLSIRRYFAVLEVLPVEQQEELRRLAADTLSRPE